MDGRGRLNALWQPPAITHPSHQLLAFTPFPHPSLFSKSAFVYLARTRGYNAPSLPEKGYPRPVPPASTNLELELILGRLLYTRSLARYVRPNARLFTSACCSIVAPQLSHLISTVHSPRCRSHRELQVATGARASIARLPAQHASHLLLRTSGTLTLSVKCDLLDEL